MPYKLTVNGQSKTVDVPPDMPLLWVLRDVLNLKGTKFGWGIGQCGACTVHIGGQARRACQTQISAVNAPVMTIEGLSPDGSHPLQKAWQYPHCGTSSSNQAFCSGCDPSGDKPSMVITGALTAEICVWQALRACPPICTVHAPHCPIPHPNFVPFMLRTSLSAQSRCMSGGTSTVFDCPFTVNL